MLSFWRLSVGFVFGAVLWLSTSQAAEAGARVYLLRGLMDLSAGLDDLAVKLKRRGVSATVASYTDETSMATAAIRNYKAGTGCPVVIIGHSLGSDAALGMARALQQSRVPVALLVSFSPAKSNTVPANVSRAINIPVKQRLEQCALRWHRIPWLVAQRRPGQAGECWSLQYREAAQAACRCHKNGHRAGERLRASCWPGNDGLGREAVIVAAAVCHRMVGCRADAA